MAERFTVDEDVEGSNPFGHPKWGLLRGGFLLLQKQVNVEANEYSRSRK